MLTEAELMEKWGDAINNPELPEIKDPYRRAVTSILLENQEQALTEANSTNVAAGVAGYDPVLISMVRRAMPHLIAYDICGVQPMTMPTGLVFAMRSRYTSQAGAEALWNEALTTFAGAQSTATFTGDLAATGNATAGGSTYVNGSLPGALSVSTTVTSASAAFTLPAGLQLDVGSPLKIVSGTATLAAGTTILTYNNSTGATTVTNSAGGTTSTCVIQIGAVVGTGITTAGAENVGPAQMGFSIEKVSVTANSYQLATGYSVELAQDMKALHGLNADTELTNILGSELLAEQNRTVLRNIYNIAKAGAQRGTLVPGQIDVGTGNDTDGRWMVEKFKGMLFQIQRDCNAIAVDTRFGKGNVLIVSADVAAALAAAGTLQWTPAIQALEDLASDFTQNTRVGSIGQIKVFVDPYATSDFYAVGYKGANPYQAGLFFTPYVPAQLLRATDPITFQPLLAMKMRYGMVQNPLAGPTSTAGAAFRSNGFYRIAGITQLVK